MLGVNVKGFHSLFDKAKESAKLSGVLLACALAIGFPFYTQTISLVGFSLGCQVAKSCVKTLFALEANDVIQNVTFLGGAADCLDKGKHKENWELILHSTIPGIVKNVYTRKDVILILYAAS